MRAWALLLLVAASGCSSILGLREAKAEADPCSSDADCIPGRQCTAGRCEGDELLCTDDALRCEGLQPERCDGERWVKRGSLCTESCANGECQTPPSCDEEWSCNNGRASCCQGRAVRGGEFSLRFDAYSPDARDDSHRRVVSPFVLDRFEVTVGRFRKFVRAYNDFRNLLKDGDGAHPKIQDSGWQSAWTNDLTRLKAKDTGIDNQLVNCGDWSDGVADDLPVRCVNWYTAFAFCVWDGGRLPTEAEWTFAAAEGDEQRIYPWSESDRVEPNASLACYGEFGPLNGPEQVGRHPDGRGAYGHDDLAGNVSEWVFDYDREELSDETCTRDGSLVDCAELTPTCCRGLKGGSFVHMAEQLRNAWRNSDDPARWERTHGFRCARDPR